MKIVEVGLRRAKEKADTVMTAGHDYPFSPGLDTDNAVGAQSIAEHYSVDAGVKTIDNLLYPFRHLRRGSVQPLIKVVSLDSIEAPGDRLDFCFHYLAGNDGNGLFFDKTIWAHIIALLQPAGYQINFVFIYRPSADRLPSKR